MDKGCRAGPCISTAGLSEGRPLFQDGMRGALFEQKVPRLVSLLVGRIPTRDTNTRHATKEKAQRKHRNDRNRRDGGTAQTNSRPQLAVSIAYKGSVSKTSNSDKTRACDAPLRDIPIPQPVSLYLEADRRLHLFTPDDYSARARGIEESVSLMGRTISVESARSKKNILPTSSSYN